MNTFFAANLLEHPLVVLLIIIAGALINWLAQRSQQQNEQREAQDDSSPSPPLREPGYERSPTTMWEDAEAAWQAETGAGQSPEPPTQTRVPPAVPRVHIRQQPAVDGYRKLPQPPDLRLKRLNEPGRRPAQTDGFERRRRPRSGERAFQWRDRKSVRQAFVASLVFGLPKGLEQ